MKKLILVVSVILFVFCFSACGSREVIDKSHFITINGETVEGLYTGNWEKGSPSGVGYLKCETFKVDYGGEGFEGNFEGETVDGVPNGKGNFLAEGDNILFSYSGEWKEGVIAGNGELEYSQLAIVYDDYELVGKFKGDVINGIPSGLGEFSAETEDTYLFYDGNWSEGHFSGDGKLDTNVYTVHFLDGIVRTGEFVGDVYDGSASGEGIFTATNDEGTRYTYDGAWENGLYNGYGECRWDSDDSFANFGTYVDGEFLPTPAEFFVSKGTFPNKPYTLSENALEFLKNYPEVFIENVVNNEKIEYENNFQYKAFAKNPSQFGSKLITVPSLRVAQIFENDYWGQKHTFIIATDWSYNVYYINVYGYWPDIYEGSYIKLTALPLDYFTYPNTSGNEVWAIACAGVRLD